MPPGLAPESQAPWPGRVPAAPLPGGQRPGRRPRRGKPVWTPGGRCGNGMGAQVSPASIPEDAGHLLSARWRRPPPAPRPPTPSVTPTSRPLPRRARRADALQPDPRPPRRRRSEGGRLPRPTLPGSEDCRQARGEDTREGKPVIADSEDAAGVSSERRLATGGGGGQEQGAARVSRPRAAGLRLAQGQHHLWAVQGGGTPPCPPPSRGLSNLSPVKVCGPHPSLRHLYFPASPKPQRM